MKTNVSHEGLNRLLKTALLTTTILALGACLSPETPASQNIPTPVSTLSPLVTPDASFYAATASVEPMNLLEDEQAGSKHAREMTELEKGQVSPTLVEYMLEYEKKADIPTEDKIGLLVVFSEPTETTNLVLSELCAKGDCVPFKDQKADTKLSGLLIKQGLIDKLQKDAVMLDLASQKATQRFSVNYHYGDFFGLYPSDFFGTGDPFAKSLTFPIVKSELHAGQANEIAIQGKVVASVNLQKK